MRVEYCVDIRCAGRREVGVVVTGSLGEFLALTVESDLPFLLLKGIAFV